MKKKLLLKYSIFKELHLSSCDVSHMYTNFPTFFERRYSNAYKSSILSASLHCSHKSIVYTFKFRNAIFPETKCVEYL